MDNWNELFEAIDEDLRSTSLNKIKKSANLGFIDNVAKEIVEDSRFDEDIKSTTKKVGQAIKRGWEGLKSKIKEVSRVGFRLGVAIGKTFANKFVLFNSSGNILTPPAEKIAYEKMKSSSKKALTIEYKVPKLKDNMRFVVGDKLDFGFGLAKGNNGEGIAYVLAPKTPGLREGIDYKKSQILNEDEKEDLLALSAAEAEIFDSFSGPGERILTKTEDERPKIAPVDVDYNDFGRELGSLLEMVKEGEVIKGGKIKTLAVYAPTGWGKSQIIETMAKEKGYHYFPMELDKVAIEVLQGFPYLADVMDLEAMPDEQKSERMEVAKKIVKLAPSEHLPPSKDEDSWLLFLDEFNRADSEKMSAVMNLLLTGELGGASSLIKSKDSEKELDRYKLPKKVVVVLAMNTSTQQGIEDALNNVKDLDIATLERVHRVVFGKYHAPSWLGGFANKPFVMELESGKKLPVVSRIPAIIKNFLIDTMKDSKEAGDKAAAAPFLLPVTVAKRDEAEGGGGERTTSPRAWTMIADRMFEDGYQMFKKVDKAGLEAYKTRAEQIMNKMKNVKGAPQNVEDYLFAAWMQDATNQIKVLAQQSPELGDEGVKYIGKMIRSFEKKAKEGLSDEDVLFNYPAIRDLFKQNYKNLSFGTHSKLLARLYNTLTKYSSESEVENFMKEKAFPILSKKGIAEQIAQTIQAIYNDLDMSGDDFITFTHLLQQKAKEGDNELIRTIHLKLAGKFDAYIEALKSKVKTKSRVEKDLAALGNKDSVSDEDVSEELLNLIGQL